eukprot:517674-Pyramimonas_sp.AAC.1
MPARLSEARLGAELVTGVQHFLGRDGWRPVLLPLERCGGLAPWRSRVVLIAPDRLPARERVVSGLLG